jgi:acetyl esterase/lipase
MITLDQRLGLRLDLGRLKALTELSTKDIAMTEATAANPAPPQVDNASAIVKADGAVQVSPFVLPFSFYASPEACLDMQQKVARIQAMRTPQALAEIAAATNPIEGHRKLADRINFAPNLEAQMQRYSVETTSGTLGGVEVQTFQPSDAGDGTNARRVLINLHGGAFMLGWPLVSQIESIPIAAVGKIKVVSVNYGMFPETRFPQGSKDVAAVYAELLKSYAPNQIGIYGCSAGGILTSQAMAWFQRQGLPLPAAIAILSASLEPLFSGDSAYSTPQFGSVIPTPKNDQLDQTTYFAGADPSDPLVSPSRHPAVLAKFPPTLIATGTRASDMSASTRGHLDLLRVGVDAQLALWDGLDHCFMYNPGTPESREVYEMVARFFNAKLC